MTSSKRIFCIFVSLVLMLSLSFNVLAEEEASLTSGDFGYIVLEDATVCITSYNGNKTAVDIPAEIDGKPVSTLGDELFWYKSDLTSVNLPETVEYIGARVFQNCTSLEKILLPDSVVEIGDACFFGCAKLAEINVPVNLVYVGAFAFDETSWITQFDGCSSIILGGRVFYKYLSNEDKVVIPEGIVCISDNAFDGKNLSFVKIPESVAFIGDYAFYNCKNLKEIKLPSEVYYLGENSLGFFAGSSELDAVKDFVIYSDENTLGESYAQEYEISLKAPSEFTEPEALPEAEVCVPTAEIRDAHKSLGNAGISQGAVVAIVLSILGCAIIVGGIAAGSHFYEKKRKQENKNTKKKKK